MPVFIAVLAAQGAAAPGQSSSAITLADIRNSFRQTGLVLPLGGKGYSVAVQPEEGGSWSFVLTGPDATVDEPDVVLPVSEAKRGLETSFGEQPYRVGFDDRARNPEDWSLQLKPTVRPPKAGHFVTLGAAKLAVFQSSPRLAGLGRGWAVLYREDSPEPQGAGEIVLLESTPSGVAFHPVPMTRFDPSGRARVPIGKRTIVLTLDEKARLSAGFAR